MTTAPDEFDVISRALDCLTKEDWPAAHALVQSLESPLACWVHGLVHKIEGDVENSQYWYGKGGTAAMKSSALTVQAQIAEIRRLLSGATGH